MKNVLTVMLLTGLSSCCLLSPRKEKYAGVVSILCAMQGAQSDVTIGMFDKTMNYRGAFMPSPDSRKVLCIAPKNVSFSSKPTKDECFDQAKALVNASLSSAWSVDIAGDIGPHCWRNGGWRSCIPGEQPFESHGFPLLKNGNLFWDSLSPDDPTTPAGQTLIPQPINVVYYVVVQSQ